MIKILVLATVVCVARAGVIGLGGHGVAVAAVHGASSYQNNNQISVHPVPVVATHAIAAAPVAIGIGHGGIGLGNGGIGLGHGGLGLH